MLSAEKYATVTKRGKICDRSQLRENMGPNMGNIQSCQTRGARVNKHTLSFGFLLWKVFVRQWQHQSNCARSAEDSSERYSAPRRMWLVIEVLSLFSQL